MKWTNKKGSILLSIIVVTLIFIDILGVRTYYYMVLEFVENQPKNFNSDAGVIFFGDHETDKNGYIHLGPDSKNRANQAIRLFNSGQIENII